MSTPNHIYLEALHTIEVLEQELADTTAALAELREHVEHVDEGRRFELLKLLIAELSDAIDFAKEPQENPEMITLKNYVDFITECGHEPEE